MIAHIATNIYGGDKCNHGENGENGCTVNPDGGSSNGSNVVQRAGIGTAREWSNDDCIGANDVEKNCTQSRY